jgi:hypothetical protein
MSQKTTYEIVIENVGLHENVKKDLSVENAEKRWIPRIEVEKLLSEIWAVLSDISTTMNITQKTHKRSLDRLFKITRQAQGIDTTKVQTEEEKEETYKNTKEYYERAVTEITSQRDRLRSYAPETSERDEMDAYLSKILRTYQDKLTTVIYHEKEEM